MAIFKKKHNCLNNNLLGNEQWKADDSIKHCEGA